MNKLFKIFVCLTVPSLMYAMHPNDMLRIFAASNLLYEAAEGTLRPGYTTLIEQAQAALAQGIDVNYQFSLERTALFLTAASNQLELAQYFIDHGAIVDSPNFVGQTPLFPAIWGNHVEMMDLLHPQSS